LLTLTFDQQLPARVPTTLPVYTVAPLAFPTRDMEGIARAWPGLSLARPKSKGVGDWAAADYGQLRLFYERLSGAVQASARKAGAPAIAGRTRFPIADDRVVEIARGFLGAVPLVEDEASKLSVGGVTHLVQQVASSDGVEPPEFLDAGVVFTRVIDETPVIGPGGNVMIKVLPDQSIGGASRVFRPRGARAATTRVMAPNDALQAFEQRLRARPLDGAVRVLRAQFGYFEAGQGLRQRFFEPVYAFVYSTGGTEPLKSVEVIQASDSNRGDPSAVTV
jgi:hypothetical protein